MALLEDRNHYVLLFPSLVCILHYLLEAANTQRHHWGRIIKGKLEGE